MEKPRVRVYSDYKSPHAFVASAPLFALEEKEGVELEWLLTRSEFLNPWARSPNAHRISGARPATSTWTPGVSPMPRD